MPLGTLKENTAFFIDPNVPSVQHAQHKIPIKVQERIEGKLNQMAEQGMITPVTEPTEWVNSTTYLIKPNGDICV